MKLEGVATSPRHGVVFDVKDRILACGGSISDFQQFSNHLLRLSIEIRASRLDELAKGIEAAGVSLTRSSVDEALELVPRTEETSISGTLVIRFVSDEPDLSMPVPAVPG